jgi:penicillin-insensitive murein endopeptidase
MKHVAAAVGVALFALSWSPSGAADPAVGTVPAAMVPAGVVPAAFITSGHRALLQLSDDQLLERLDADPESLGSLSVGRPNRGALVGGVQMTDGAHYTVEAPAAAWGTAETVSSLSRAIARVHQQFADTPALFIGHLSRREGGRLSPHRSHQSGRDVDISYYYVPKKHHWYRRANAKTLDVARSWAFVRALVTESDVEYIFINRSVQRLLKTHALAIGEDPTWLDSVFQYRSLQPAPIVRHASGHDTHIHIRFFNPVAQELATRLHPALVKQGLITRRFLRYRARKGDRLSRLARRFGTTVRRLKRVNGLPTSRIRAGRVYLVPRKGTVPSSPVIVVPPRRLPPTRDLTPVAASGGRRALAGPESAPQQ